MTAGKRWLFLLGLVLVLFGGRAIAQEATIVGSVTDQTGAVVPGATITIISTDTGQARIFTTAADGEFVAPALPIGHYSIKVAAKSFKTSEKSGLTLNVGDRIREDFQLQVGNAEQTVEVTGAAEVHLQTESGEVSDLISGKQIAQLTTNGKSVYTLVNLTPGASSVQPDFQVPVPVGGDANVSFNGQRMAHNLYLLDGGENLDRGGAGTFSVMPSLESLAEFRVLSSNYSAEYGLSSSATMTTVLKQGSKQFHGSAWEFDRNDALDARNYFNQKPAKVAKLRFNTYGFNIGGPVSFHPHTGNPSTFFFYNMEWRKLIQGQTLNQTVPMPATYGGNFSSISPSLAKFHVPCANQLSTAQQARFATAGITLSTADPATGSCSGSGAVLQAWPTTTIPSVLLDANAQALLSAKIFPAPTSGTQFQGGNNAPTDVREEIVRVDQRFGDKFNIFGHWISEQILQTYGTTMWSGDNVPTIGNTFGNPSYSAVIHATHTINTSLLNEMAFNYNGNRIHILPKAQFGAPLNAPSGFTFNRIFTTPNSIIPTINLANLGTQYSANWTPWNNKADDYQIRDDLSWSRGAHQFKFGASWALYKKIQDAFAATQGNFDFNGFYTGNDFADFLLGYSDSYQEDAIHDSGHWNNVSWALYGQDNWRVNSRLTLNLGLRWDGVPHTYEANHRASNFYPSLYNAANAATFDANGNICSGVGNGCAAASPGLGTSPNAILAGYKFYTNGLGIDGLNGIPKGLVDNHWAAFGPRVGFAYDVTGRGKTVFRGGFGMMYERIQGNDMYNGATNVPFDAKANFSNVLLANPHTSTKTGATLTVPIVPGAIVGMDRSMYKLPSSTQYSIGIQQELTPKTLLSAAYVGTQNRHLSDWLQSNLPPESALPGLISSGGAGLNQKVQYLGYGEIRMARDEANSKYNSIQVDLHTVIRNDLQAQFGYTLSKAYDPVTNNGGNGGDLNFVNNPYAGWKYDWGPSLFDRPNIAFVNFMYDAPWFRTAGNPFVKTMLGGWGLSGIVTMQSGAPLEPLVGGSQGGQGLTGLNARTRPDLVGGISYPKKLVGAGIQWFDPSAFKAPTPGAWGNLKHSAVRGPGRDDWNLALHKNFSFAEKANFEFRAEAFNVWNHTQFRADQQAGGYGQNLSGSNFGVITQTHDPRVLQLGGKLSF
ncbi:MAG TPA: carboxypeptidase regulatory-like domain-containing protein [Acidobacteriaceae bacterium]|nr:carboxypeptidase regulatory-like domain-containing protein [Acidobacteriaceae bacterium]